MEIELCSHGFIEKGRTDQAPKTVERDEPPFRAGVEVGAEEEAVEDVESEKESERVDE